MATQQTPTPAFDTVGFITGFEEGTLELDEVIAGFQHLIDTGLAWQLQGVYGRTAEALIKGGYCTAPGGEVE